MNYYTTLVSYANYGYCLSFRRFSSFIWNK